MGRPRFLVSWVGVTGELGWRLLSPNHRPLACSASTFASVDACSAGIEEIRQGLARISGVQSLDLTAGSWVWRAELDDSPVAVSCRGYEGQRECESSLRLFLAAVAVADVSADGRHITLPEPRRVVDLLDTVTPARVIPRRPPQPTRRGFPAAGR